MVAQTAAAGKTQQQRNVAGEKKQQQHVNAVKPVNGHKGSNSSIDKSAHAASLMEKVPSHDKIDESVKVQAGDVAEQAERQAALAAVEVVKEKDQVNGKHVHGEENASPLQATISKRIKVLNKKLQRAVSYAELPEEKLNDDMKRIVASKGNLEGSVSELVEVLKAIQLSEKEAKKVDSSARKSAPAQVGPAENKGGEKEMQILFQLLHLNSLISASMQASFAPPPLPTILQQATSQHVAAISKIVADLSAANEVNSFDVKSTTLKKLAGGSSESIVNGASFKDVLTIVEGLSTSSVQQTTVQGSEKPSKDAEESQTSSQPSILFMQASEIQQAESKPTNDAPADAKQAEPEGGAVDGVASKEIAGGATTRGEQGAKGAILGDMKSDNAQRSHDGTAKSAVLEPVTTTEVSAPTSSIATPKVIDWSAHDDDDFGDLDIQPDPAPASISAAAKQALESGASPTKATEKTRKAAAAQASTDKKIVGQQERNRADSNSPANAANKQAKNAKIQPAGNAPSTTIKAGPEVDEDGFIVASSKRTKHLQQLQLQQQQRGGRTGGGRGGGRGAAANSASRGRGSSSTTSGAARGHGRGRGGSNAAESES